MSSDPPPHMNPPPSPTASSVGTVSLHRQHHLLPAPPPPPPPSSPSSSTLAPREYRKGNWTLHETLVLITAKRLDDERRSSRSHACPSPSSLDIKPNIDSSGNAISSPSSSSPQCRSAELRWKWVENYCWKNGCLRSQNQCNDKWDNLLRDYKKVRDYEARCAQSKVDGGGSLMISYWAMEKHNRKERNLPSNLVAEVFHALTDVLSRRNAHKGQISANPNASAVAAPSRPPVVPTVTMTSPPPPLPPLQPHPVNHLQLPQQQIATGNLSPPPPPAVKRQQVEQSVPETSTSSETERSTESSRKRRKKGEATGTDWGASVVKAASVLARTLTECEQKREKRHREMMELQERRLRMELERTEISRHGISGLIAAVNGLSGAIHALVSDHHRDSRNR